MKGIVLAGGLGTRLFPLTVSISKQLLPVYDKPMIYYPISTLMSMGIQDVLIITSEHDNQLFKNLLGDGSQFGCRFEYKIQYNPVGLADAFILGEDFIGEDSVCLILGDNIFSGIDFSKTKKRIKSLKGGMVFAYEVNDPERYGVVSFDKDNKVTSIEEKPTIPKSRFAIPGLYFYDNTVIEVAKNIKPSSRGELEITDVNKVYLEKGDLQVQRLKRGVAWLDTGTFESLTQAGQYVQSIEDRQGIKIGCLEEIAYNHKWITKEELLKISDKYRKNSYGEYLKRIAKEKK
tara:strand:+ start:2184 stop:3053 length:870 start_codon:yes stop_codon:yes gene_type:complete